MRLLRHDLGTVLLLCFLPAARLAAQSVIHLGGQTPVDSSYINRPIPSEHMLNKRFSWKRRVVQNLVTRDNYYFHAAGKLEAVEQAVRAAHPEHFDSLLDVYPWSFHEFQPYKEDLDSVILKAGIGIEIHDPRSKWIPELYLLVGKASFYEQQDSQALRAFQFINRTYGPHDADGNPLPIGSPTDGSHAPSISSPESGKPPLYPARNDALVWLIRTYMVLGQEAQALPLLETLLHDPRLPSRLRPDLLGLQAFWYARTGQYRQELESLGAALEVPQPKYLRTRWYFLMGQLEERLGEPEKAYFAYQRCAALHPDPLMAFYARVRMAEANTRMGPQQATTGNQTLEAMAHRSRYERYRGILYYELGRLSMQSGQQDRADSFFRLSVRAGEADKAQKQQSYLVLAHSYEQQGAYVAALHAYDSLVRLGGATSAQQEWSTHRKLLGQLVDSEDQYRKDDSLLALGALPPNILKAKLERILKDSLRARRHVFRQEAETQTSGTVISQPSVQTQTSAGGTWYFYNAAAKARGYAQFQAIWGNRPLEDNWRTSDQASGLQAQAVQPILPEITPSESPQQLTLGDLEAAIPRDSASRQAARARMAQALYDQARLLEDELSHPKAAVQLFRRWLERFSGDSLEPKVLYRLQLLSSNLGESTMASTYQRLLSQRFPQSPLNQPERTSDASKVNSLYDSAYVLYLSGAYSQVLHLVELAQHGSPTGPQPAHLELLEACSLIKQGQDSLATPLLVHLLRQPGTDPAVAAQAGSILDAMAHKASLIDHLLKYEALHQVTNQNDQTLSRTSLPAGRSIRDSAANRSSSMAQTAAPRVYPRASQHLTGSDSSRMIPSAPAASRPSEGSYTQKADEPYFVVLAYGRTDQRLMAQSLDEALAYDKAHHPTIEVGSYVLKSNQALLIFRIFPNESAALQFVRELREQAAAGLFQSLTGSSYRILAISRDNFVTMNRLDDWAGYLRFYNARYR